MLELDANACLVLLQSLNRVADEVLVGMPGGLVQDSGQVATQDLYKRMKRKSASVFTSRPSLPT
ncbi:MAG: hypothetical protein JF888_13470 [Candidatus Dormibacteraeota bacterium]|uniref:Uncharacterized protein n=1 Tax=Candidatus Dormiibacter inghamiae TaxID=3127013 RepID=A0A934KBL3_9BACT|nr:hypothetical protein [Candidatus Dormibacteraeota bacterium]MBJ7606400.1 hypothetical protein [Candidatus Dormibacteraeota bacterium]